jgi:hypothetical protein
MEFSGKSKSSHERIDITQAITSNLGDDASFLAALREVTCMMQVRSIALHTAESVHSTSLLVDVTMSRFCK